MVLIDGVKYACQSCIKGHRSSKCTHTTRPLQEIKKKGRPTSQCAHCRELRKTKSVHARCDCAARAKEKDDKPTPRLLPNGLVDAMLLTSLAEGNGDEPEASGSGEGKLVRTEKSGVTRLLNPCNCLNGGKCTCCTAIAPLASKAFPGETTSGGCCGGDSSSSAAVKVPTPPPAAPKTGGCCGSARPPSPTPESFFVNPEQPPLPLEGDILVSFTPVNADDYTLPTPPTSFTPSFSPSLSSSGTTTPSTNPLLFTPSTHGTSSCFCGPTCSCVGCAVHDPMSRKRPAEGGCEGGGCKCGDPGAAGCGGKRARTGADRKAKSGGCCGGGGGAKKVADPVEVEKPASSGGGCCGSKKGKGKAVDGGAGPTSAAPATTTGIELPSLWALQEEDVGATGEAVAAPLPSLRTLWPALVDPVALSSASTSAPLTTLDALPAFPTFLSQTSSALSSSPAASAPAPPASTGYVSVVENSAGCGQLYGEAFAPACGEDAMIDAGEDAPGCECSSGCGCRGGLVGGEGALDAGGDTDADGETDPDFQPEPEVEEEGWVSVQRSVEVAADQELEELARKAEMGLFG